MNDDVSNGVQSTPNGNPSASPAKSDQQVPTKINWDDTHMATVFANVVNVLQTREEIAILFGTNLTWNAFESREITVNLSNRIVLTPHAAKRLSELLTNRLRDYESRFGTLKF